MMDSQFPAAMLDRIERCGVIAVLVIERPEDAIALAKALLAGGIDVMELTLRTPHAIPALRMVREHVPEMLAGIGTVLTCQQVDQVIDAGAAFGVSPGLNPEVVRHAQQRAFPFAPGVVTPSDVERAVELGCRELKFFPAEPSGGVPYLNSVNAPSAHLGLRYIPLGGLNANNASRYLDLESVVAVGGSWLAPRSLIAQQDWTTITANAAEARTFCKEKSS
ncbi:MAG: bifunctional 4-hydroxy-2-oxoglutarate aldolase/2-dehydro-3-deoxy-phosphogluconate aldolase [Pirellulales bacterium]|nr:bifunctional 4-hydroxy-2-oxoglutarate aldolase/2-dehydro-3-deoxy-phosphogluconate aldolase [Pirellulales bacterium]